MMATLPFKPTEQMTFTSVEADTRRLVEYCRKLRSQTLTLDLTNVNNCDSAGLAFLIEAKRLARERGKKCKIEGMTKIIHALAEFCGVETILTSD